MARAEREALLRALLDSAICAVITTDETGAIESVNPATVALFGYSPEELVGRKVNVLMPPPDRELHDSYIAEYLRTGERRIVGIGREVSAQRKDGTVFPAYIAVSEFRVAGKRHFTGMVHDLSSQKEAEAELRESRRKLAEQESLARLGQLAAVVAHEVKNAQAGVTGALRVLSERLGDREDSRQVIDDIIERLEALDEFMGDVLTFARPRKLLLAPVPLRLVLDDTVRRLSTHPDFRGITVEIGGDDPLVRCDAELIRPVLANLLINAAQALEGEGTVAVFVTAGAVDSLNDRTRWCEVTVRDHGPGMPLDVRERAFEPFFTTKRRGTGLGLSIAKRVVDLHGGTIAIELPAAGGTCVRVRLPMDRAGA
jgi:two-component system sensor kinase FixL